MAGALTVEVAVGGPAEAAKICVLGTEKLAAAAVVVVASEVSAAAVGAGVGVLVAAGVLTSSTSPPGTYTPAPGGIK